MTPAADALGLNPVYSEKNVPLSNGNMFSKCAEHSIEAGNSCDPAENNVVPKTSTLVGLTPSIKAKVEYGVIPRCESVELNLLLKGESGAAIFLPEAPRMEQHQCADDTSEDRPQVISLLLQECRRIQRLSLKSGDNIDTAATNKSTCGARMKMIKVYAGLLFFLNMHPALGAMYCDANHVQLGAVVTCTCNVSANAVTHWTIGTKCLIALGGASPCNRPPLYRSCDYNVSAVNNYSTCTTSILTLRITDSSMNNTQIACVDAKTLIKFYTNLTIDHVQPSRCCSVPSTLSPTPVPTGIPSPTVSGPTPVPTGTPSPTASQAHICLSSNLLLLMLGIQLCGVLSNHW